MYYQDLALKALRASGQFRGIGGRSKATGELLCEYVGMPQGDYLRLGANGHVLNPAANEQFTQASLIVDKVLYTEPGELLLAVPAAATLEEVNGEAAEEDPYSYVMGVVKAALAYGTHPAVSGAMSAGELLVLKHLGQRLADAGE